MRAIFISYRRDDAEGHAGRLFGDLCQRFGNDRVFMDVAGIEPGVDFRRVIDQQVAACGVLLAVIGRDWLTAPGADGRRRLDDPLDFVRLETAAALRRGIPVVPVLVHEARMPRSDELPEDLKELAYRHAVELSHARWDSDVEALARALRKHLEADGTIAAPSPAGAIAATASGLAPPAEAPPPAPARASAWRRMALPVVLAVAAVGGGTLAVQRLQQAERERAEAAQRALEQAEVEARRAREEAARVRDEAERQARENEAALERARSDAERASAEKAAAARAAEERAAAARAADERAAALQAEKNRLVAEAAEAARARAQAEPAARPAPAHWVRNMTLAPPSPAALANGEVVQVSFDYATRQSEGVRVVAIPLVGGGAAPSHALRGSSLLPAGQGRGTAAFTIKAGTAKVDGIKVRMTIEGQSLPLFETTLRVRYDFQPVPPAQGSSPSATVQIAKAVCTRGERGTYRVEAFGGVTGPEGAVLWLGVAGRAEREPPPVSEMDCGSWRRTSGNLCTRADTTAAATRWRLLRSFAAAQPPTHVEAGVYPDSRSKTRIAEHRVDLDCR